ncbi:MAG: hypothetical protein QXR48_03690 [Candidatus Woesearchaeota archaeon]
MRKTILEFEHQKAFHQPTLPVSLPPEKDTDDYEDFDDDEEMMQTLWHKGEESFEDEMMKEGEDY